MNKFKNINYLVDNQLIDLSIRQIRRRAKELYELNDQSVISISNNTNRPEYRIDINQLNKFHRIREKKKSIKNSPKESGTKKIINVYDTNICINIKSDDVGLQNHYDYEYNKFIAETLFRSLKVDLYYVIEQEDKTVNHFHLHMGIKRGSNSIEDVKNKIEELLYRSFYISNEAYKDHSGSNRKVIYVEDMISDFANREYLKKGSDHLGGIIPTFLTVKKRLNIA
ncbi:hypothetical protein HXZ94_15275 [Empedobacter falsenii]|uniref:hypothetical protein n=1 Tax=Empedobacter falsenii TaxID=343874 RepID=UPI002578C58A|nr:hypothetical protein [Empedobacter falsenii]MDM1299856.1 hypothetical protein [Empedobacter falsenii]MDM1319642.1 hypothetical protein [Empedobacter falsenii]